MTFSNPLHVRIGYGAAEIGVSGSEVLIRIALLVFYTDTVGLSADLAGVAVALGVVWDAITDPFMGTMSDRWQPRFGRRPFILIGSIVLALGTLLVFHPPSLTSQSMMFTYLLGSYLLLNTGMTIIAVPLAALAGDLTHDGQERTQLFAWRLLFANIGFITATVVPGLMLVIYGEVYKAGQLDSLNALVIATLTIVTALLSWLATAGRDRTKIHQEVSLNYREQIRGVLSNRVFLVLLVAFIIANVGLTINSSLALYYYRYRLNLPEADVRLLIAFFMVVFCLCLPVWVWISGKIGKRVPLATGVMLLGLMTCIAYPLFPPAVLAGPYIAAVLGGIFVGSVVLLEAAVADTADRDEQETGVSRLGLYFGVWRLGSKLARAIAVLLVGYILTAIGFIPNAVQSVETSWYLALWFGPGVGVFFIASAMLVMFGERKAW